MSVDRVIRVTVAADLADVVGDRMWQWGVRAVSEVEADDGTVELTTSVGSADDAIDRAIASLDAEWSWTVENVESSSGTEDWRRFATPTWYRPGGVVVPAWHTGPEVDADVVVTRIEPGAAFGLGDHPTTQLSMATTADHIATGAVASVLDVGCGTGAIAVLAAQLGVATVRAIDIADAAVEATRTNAELNGVAGHIVVDTTPIHELTGEFDLVVANILAPTLIALADDLRRLAGDGLLVVSGILADRHDHVLAALAPLVVRHTATLDGWAAVTLGSSSR